MRTEINTIVFSKNRACQLDLFLRNFNMPAVVIYTHDPEFETGYLILTELYPEVTFLKQVDMKQQILDNMTTDYTMFQVDDDIMLEHFFEDCPEFQELKTNTEILCLSLRLCPTYVGYPGDSTNKWNWRGQKHSWGYPMADTATIFRTSDILDVIKNMPYAQIPHTLEIAMRRNPPDRPLMSCFSKPKMITNEANIVQDVYPSKNFGVDIRMLEEEFLKGRRLSLEHMMDEASRATGCFMRIGYNWETICQSQETEPWPGR